MTTTPFFKHTFRVLWVIKLQDLELEVGLSLRHGKLTSQLKRELVATAHWDPIQEKLLKPEFRARVHDDQLTV